MQTLYDAAGGRPALAALAGAWHERCLADPVVSHAFEQPGQHPHHLDRLTAYWVEALGGPSDFTEGLGDDESHVVRLHSGNGEHAEMDQRAVACFVAALDDAGLPDDPRLRGVLVEWFTWATAQMSTYHHSADDVPAGLPLPRWGWEGLVGA